MGATFNTVSGVPMTLGEIKGNEACEFGGDTLQTLKGNGATLAMYTYLNEATLAAFNEDPDLAALNLKVGWYDFDAFNNDEFIPCNDVEIPYGSMFVMQAGSDDSGLTFAGSVASEDAELSIVSGQQNMRSNCMPVDYKLADLSGNDAFEFGGDTLQTLKGNGATLAMYTYLNEATLAAFNEDPDLAALNLKVGWYDFDAFNNDEFIPCNDVDMPAGYGFILQAGSDDATVIVPSPIAK